MRNKLLIFVICLLIGLAIFLAGYLFNKKMRPTDQQALINNSLVSRFAKSPEKYLKPTGLFALSSGEAKFPFLSPDGKELWYYISRSGEIRSSSLENPLAGSTLIAKIQPGAGLISWGNNKTLLASYANENIYYDIDLNFSKKYDSKIKRPVLSETGSKIAYISIDEVTGEGNLSIADPKLEHHKNIMPTRFADWQISWVRENKLALLKLPTLADTALSLFILDTDTGGLENILNSKNNLEAIWSSSGDKLLYSYTDPFTGQNGLHIMTTSNKKEMSLNQNFKASHCVWSIDQITVYCAEKDSFVYLNTSVAPFQIQTVANSQSTTPTSATNLLLTSAENQLIFRNSEDGRLYGLNLHP